MSDGATFGGGAGTAFTHATFYNEAGDKIAAATQTSRLFDLPEA